MVERGGRVRARIISDRGTRYASRDLVLGARVAKRIQTGGGFVAPAVLVDGRVVGTWRRDGKADWLELFEPLADDALEALQRERADVQRYLAATP